jgi:uncharacterized protein (DUF4415 family)
MSDERWRNLTKSQREQIERLDAMSDDEIDLSDIPEHRDPEFWAKAEVGKFYKPVKQQLTLRLDSDVIAWFRRTQPKYQTAMNEALRTYMVEHARKSG